MRVLSKQIQLLKKDPSITHEQLLKMSYKEVVNRLSKESYDLNNPITHADFTIQNSMASGNIGRFANAK